MNDDNDDCMSKLNDKRWWFLIKDKKIVSMYIKIR